MIRKAFWLWLPVLLWCSLIFYLSNIPYLKITEMWWDYPLRKLAHMGEYAVLALLLTRALGGSTSGSKTKIFYWSFALCAIYSATDEYHQGFVPGRVANPMDVLIDTAGAL